MPDNGMGIHVDGLAELERKMKGLPLKVARNALRSAVRAGASIVRKDAMKRAPVGTGRLKKRGIVISRQRDKSPRFRETFVVRIRAGKKERSKDRDAFYWFFFEFGTIKMPAQPFLRPAFESKKYEALTAMAAKLGERIQKFARQP